METPVQPGRAPATTRLPRIAIGGILHETNTFSPSATTLADFAERTLLRGHAMIESGAGTDSALGGAIAAARGRATLVPTIFASAMPGGFVADVTFATLSDDLLDRVRRAHNHYPRLDGVVLLLHGAMVTVSDPDPEATLIERVRAMVGPCPISVVLDSHANVSRRMTEAADMMVSYERYPHVDIQSRGRDALMSCLGMIEEGWRPVPVIRKLPLLMPLIAQATEPGGPLAPVLERAAQWRSQRHVASISIVPGFPFSDVPDAGATVLVYTWEHFRTDAPRIAEDLAELWWSLRDRFDVAARPLEEIRLEGGSGLTVIADVADNPGAGAPGDGTHILRHFIERGIGNAAFATIVDPQAVAACHEAGRGRVIELAVGGKGNAIGGMPVHGGWRIDHLGAGIFANEGPMARGSEARIGRTATVRLGGISVILSERRAQALDPAVFRVGGIEPEGCRWLVVKSSVHYRAAFRAMANEMIDVECPGSSTSHLRSLPYNRVPRPIVPLDAFDSPPDGQDRPHA